MVNRLSIFDLENMSNNQQPKSIIEGFSDDLEDIVEKFTKEYPQHQLLDFLSLWETEHLDYLFANRFDPRELAEAISEMNDYLIKLLVGPSSQTDMMKIVSIYFLLCIYIKQPERFRSKFRLTCDDLISVEDWTNRIMEDHKNPDPKFALRRLKALESFDLVEERTIYGPSMIRRNFKDIDETASPVDSKDLKKRETINFFESKIEPMLSELKSLNETYEHSKQSSNLAYYQQMNDQGEAVETVGHILNRAVDMVTDYKFSIQ